MSRRRFLRSALLGSVAVSLSSVGSSTKPHKDDDPTNYIEMERSLDFSTRRL